MIEVSKTNLSLLASLCGLLPCKRTVVGPLSWPRLIGLSSTVTGKLQFQLTDGEVWVEGAVREPDSREAWSVALAKDSFGHLASQLHRVWPHNSLTQSNPLSESVAVGPVSDRRFGLFKQEFRGRLPIQRSGYDSFMPSQDAVVRWEADAGLDEFLDMLTFLRSGENRDVTDNARHHVSLFSDGFAYSSLSVLKLRAKAPRFPETISIPKANISAFQSILKRLRLFAEEETAVIRVAALTGPQGTHLRVIAGNVAMYVRTSPQHFQREAFDRERIGQANFMALVDRKMLMNRCKLFAAQANDGLLILRLCVQRPGFGAMKIAVQATDGIEGGDVFDVCLDNEPQPQLGVEVAVSARAILRALGRFSCLTVRLSVLNGGRAIVLRDANEGQNEVLLGVRSRL